MIVAEDTDIAVLTAVLTPRNLEIFILKAACSTVADTLYSSKSLPHMHVNIWDNILFLV